MHDAQLNHRTKSKKKSQEKPAELKKRTIDENCEKADANPTSGPFKITWSFECPLYWESLQEKVAVKANNERFCNKCQKTGICVNFDEISRFSVLVF